ncbi:MAG: SCO family protein [Acidobacteria bacterium]|nr:SCO family protein [Acidobacteriota bacterium]
MRSIQRFDACASLVSFVWFVVFATPAFAQMGGVPAPGYKTEAGMSSSSLPPALKAIGFDQHIDERLPLDVPFTDDAGRQVRLGDYFGKRPVVLTFAYFECPMLCTMSLNGLVSALKVLSLEPGADFEVVTISFDPKDTPAAAAGKKAQYVERYRNDRAAGAWHFLTGGEEAIQRVTGAAGFRYAWDEETQQFAHPTGIIVATPDGRLARYLFGIEYGPRDLRYALVEASGGRVGTPVDALLLYCFHYDPMTGRYGLVVMRAIRIAAAATVLALGAFIVVMVRRERTRAPGAPGASSAPAGAPRYPGT